MIIPERQTDRTRSKPSGLHPVMLFISIQLYPVPPGYNWVSDDSGSGFVHFKREAAREGR